MLVFVLCMNTYATAVLLGGPRFKMMAPAVYDQFVRGNNWPFGAALTIVMMLFLLIWMSLYLRAAAREARAEAA